MKIFRISIPVIILCCSLQAQNIWVQGQVLHSQTRRPVAGAEILEKGSFRSGFTNEEGIFKLSVSNWPTTLIFTHPRYSTRQIFTERDSLQVLLEPLSLELAPVSKSEDTESFTRLASRVRDFYFYDQMIFLLGNSGKEVRLIDKEGTLVERTLTPAKMEGLLEDCLGNLFAFSRDSAYQVFYNYEDIYFINPLSIADFQEFILPCRCYFKGGLIFTVSRRRNLVTSVKYATDRGLVATVREFADSSALNLLDEKYDREYFVNRGLQGYDAQLLLGQLTEEKLVELQEDAKLTWLDNYSIRPNKVFAFSSEDHFSIFDLKEMKQYFYTSINSEPVEITLKLPAEDAQRMLRDEVSGELYILYKMKSTLILRPLNSNKMEVKIEEFPFPSETKINNGDVYFISNPALDGGNYLFRKN